MRHPMVDFGQGTVCETSHAAVPMPDRYLALTSDARADPDTKLLRQPSARLSLGLAGRLGKRARAGRPDPGTRSGHANIRMGKLGYYGMRAGTYRPRRLARRSVGASPPATRSSPSTFPRHQARPHPGHPATPPAVSQDL